MEDPFNGIIRPGQKMRDMIHTPTQEIIKDLLDIIYRLKEKYFGDVKNTDITTNITNIIFITEEWDKQDVSRLIKELTYTSELLRDFILKGSRKTLLEYYTEEQLEDPNFFQEALGELNEFIRFSQLISNALEKKEDMLLGWVYLAVMAFRKLLVILKENSHNIRSIIFAVLADELAYEKDKKHISEKLLQIHNDIGNLGGHIFSRLFLTKSPNAFKEDNVVGEDVYNDLLKYLPGLEKKLQYLINLIVSDLDHLELEQSEKQNLLLPIQNEAKYLLENYVNKIMDPENQDKLINQPRSKSMIRDFMASIINWHDIFKLTGIED